MMQSSPSPRSPTDAREKVFAAASRFIDNTRADHEEAVTNGHDGDRLLVGMPAETQNRKGQILLAAASTTGSLSSMSLSPSDLSTAKQKKNRYSQPSARRERATSCVLGMFVLGAIGSVLIFILGRHLFSGQAHQFTSINMEELRVHSSPDDCWQLIHGKVYDLSDYRHPGGRWLLTPYCGTNATKSYDVSHASQLLVTISNYQVGSSSDISPPSMVRISFATLQQRSGDNQTDCWTSIDGNVYNMTGVDLPQGDVTIATEDYCGGDGGQVFNNYPPRVFDSIVGQHHIGFLITEVGVEGRASIDASELAQHDDAETDCWVAMHGIVYDMTDYAQIHPGGNTGITAQCGGDGTLAYDLFHAGDKMEYLFVMAAPYVVGPYNIEEHIIRPPSVVQPSNTEELTNRSLDAIAFQEVEQHNVSPSDCWTIADGQVYNLTGITLPDVLDLVAPVCGVDASGTFANYPATLLDSIIGSHLIGTLYSGRGVNTTELVLHDDEETDCWVVIHTKVYDMTKYSKLHPGDTGTITSFCGSDGTAAFELYHEYGLLIALALDYEVGLYIETPVDEAEEESAPLPVISHSELLLHDDRDADCWVIMHRNVYNMTAYAKVHPGGAPSITAFCGADGSDGFEAFHGLGLLQHKAAEYLVGSFDTTRVKEETYPVISHADLLLHDDDESDCWVAMHESVYNMTDYAPLHPGHARTITPFCGGDGTEAFSAYHGVGLLFGKAKGYKVGNYNVTSIADVTAAPMPVISPAVLSLHDDAESDCWVAMHETVYNMTDYAVQVHPGGVGSITSFCGLDGTEAFSLFHGAGLLRSRAADYAVGWYEPKRPASVP